MIRQGDSSWREERCVCPGETGVLSGELCQAGDRDRVRTAGWALTEGLWLNSAGNRFPGLGNLLNNLPGSAGMIKILPLFRKVHNRLKLTWEQGFILALVFKLVLYFCLGLLSYFECSLQKKTPNILNYFVMKANF